jgi:HEAT repeat protein
LRSDSATAQAAAERLIEGGAASTAGLLQLVADPAPMVRRHAMFALSRIADPATATVFRAALRNTDAGVRAYAAQGLRAIGDRDALKALLDTIDDMPDELHGDYTPSVHALGDAGLAAVAPLLDLMLSDAVTTRLHAQRALQAIVDRRHGFVTARGFPLRADEDAVRALWKANGHYNPVAPADERASAVALWREWLRSVEA